MDIAVAFFTFFAVLIGLLNMALLMALSATLVKLVESLGETEEEPQSNRDAGLVDLQDDRPGNQWGPHVNYQDVFLSRPYEE